MTNSDQSESRRSGGGLPPGGEPAIAPDGGAGTSDQDVGIGGTSGGGGIGADGDVGGSDPGAGTTPGAGGAASGNDNR